MEIADRVKKVIAKELGREAVYIKSTDNIIDDLGAESLDTIEITMSLEEEFGIEITDEDMTKFATVGDVVRYIEGRV